MKQILKSITIIVVVIIVASCNQNSPAPSPATPSSPTSPTSNMSAFETSLVGSWKLKRSENRSTSYPGLGDSIINYTNHYNYTNSLLELTSNSSVTGYYDGIFGISDLTPSNVINWKGSSNNNILTLNGYNFNVKYLSTDSLVMDYGGVRYYYNKNTLTPKLNNVEMQLLGNPWQLISQNGVSPSFTTFMTFKNYWSNICYHRIDSVFFNPSQPATLGGGYWEVLYPNRSIPILFGTGGTSYAKIITLTANSLRIEGFNENISSASTSTLIYSR
jgi:hypothetical protein